MSAFVRSLEDCLANTHQAEDRSIYEKYLADAAGILASCVAGEPIANVVRRIGAHERLWATPGSKTRYTARRHRPGAPLKNRLTTLPPSLGLCAGGFGYGTKKG